MCLYADQKEFDKLKSSKKEVIDVYKIYLVNREKNQLIPPFRFKPVIKNSGIVKSNRKSNKISKSEIITDGYGGDYVARIHKGIHVLLSKISQKSLFENEMVLKCKAKLANLVAAGDGEAVFTEIEIPKSEWKRIFSPKKKTAKKTETKVKAK